MRGKFKNLYYIGGFALLAFVGASIILPILASSNHASPRTWCISNLKQLGTSTQIYVADFDDRFPPRKWVDELFPYFKNRTLLTCVGIASLEKKWGYAMHSEIMGKKATTWKEPNKVVVFFETDALAPDIVANLAARSLTRHGTGANAGSVVSYADSSAKFKRGSERP